MLIVNSVLGNVHKDSHLAKEALKKFKKLG